MKEQFTKKLHLNKANKAMLSTINTIIESYSEQGYVLTLRQLYYQLVARDIIANKTTEYAKLSRLLKKGRMAGVVDWESIEDRTRQPYIPYSASSIQEALNDLSSWFRIDRQQGQNNYIEILVEKDALSGVLKRITSKYHVRLLVNRGYTSVSAMYKSYQRLIERAQQGQSIVLLYIGDHDPSGLDMVRDVTERLETFGVTAKIEHVALTQAQIKKFDPPPNPAKIKDPRAKWYIKNFGNTSWEVDAIDPTKLNEIVSSKIEKFLDMDKFHRLLKEEQKKIEQLQKFAYEYPSMANKIGSLTGDLKQVFSKKKLTSKEKATFQTNSCKILNELKDLISL